MTESFSPAHEAPGEVAQGESSLELTLTGVSVVVAFAGLGLAWLFYIKRRDLPDKIANSLGGLYTAVLNKYYVDEIYGAAIIRPADCLLDARALARRGRHADRRQRGKRRARRARDRRLAAPPAVGQHSLLRRLGGRRSRPGRAVHGLDGDTMIGASFNPYILTLVVFAPAVGAVLLAVLPRRDRDIRGFAMLVAIVTFLLSLHLPWYFHSQVKPAQPQAAIPLTSNLSLAYEVNHSWISTPNIHYHVGIDGISLWLVLLTTFLVPLCVLISWRSIQDRVKEFFILMLVLETAMIGVFVALDLFLFYFFWEATLIPMALLIGMYGHERRVYAAVKFFLYTMIALGVHAGGHHLALRQDRNLRLRDHPGVAPGRPGARDRKCGAVAFPGILYRLRRKGAAVPAAHLAAGRPRGSAHRRLGSAGRRAAEDGNLRPVALQRRTVPGRGARAMPAGSPCWPSSASSTARWLPWCSRT